MKDDNLRILIGLVIDEFLNLRYRQMRSGKEAMFMERNFNETFLIRKPPYLSIRSASILTESNMTAVATMTRCVKIKQYLMKMQKTMKSVVTFANIAQSLKIKTLRTGHN